jgi:hypothetical protein
VTDQSPENLHQAADRSVLSPVFRAILWVLDPRDNPGSLIYGLLTVGAVISAESGTTLHQGREILAAAAAVFIYFMIHGYSTLLGNRLGGAGVLGRRELRQALRDELAILRGASLPVLAMVVAMLLGANANTMEWAGILAAVLLLVLFEALAGLRSHLDRHWVWLQAALGAFFGLLLAMLKVLAG